MDNTISSIANMVDAAKLSKPRVQATADRVALYFVPCILALTQGKFAVVEEIYCEGYRKKATSIATRLTSRSKHPVSQALTRHLGSFENSPISLQSVSSAVEKRYACELGSPAGEGRQSFLCGSCPTSQCPQFIYPKG